MTRPLFCFPYHRLLFLGRHGSEEASFVGWCGITVWLMIGYVLYAIEILPTDYP